MTISFLLIASDLKQRINKQTLPPPHFCSLWRQFQTTESACVLQTSEHPGSGQLFCPGHRLCCQLGKQDCDKMRKPKRKFNAKSDKSKISLQHIFNRTSWFITPHHSRKCTKEGVVWYLTPDLEKKKKKHVAAYKNLPAL